MLRMSEYKVIRNAMSNGIPTPTPMPASLLASSGIVQGSIHLRCCVKTAPVGVIVAVGAAVVTSPRVDLWKSRRRRLPDPR